MARYTQKITMLPAFEGRNVTIGTAGVGLVVLAIAREDASAWEAAIAGALDYTLADGDDVPPADVIAMVKNQFDSDEAVNI